MLRQLEASVFNYPNWQPAQSISGVRMLILFVSADTAEQFKALLCACRLHAQLYAAKNLDECHYAVTQHNFDLIIFDRNLIGQGIFSPADHVRKAGYDCPVLTYHDAGIRELKTFWLNANKKSPFKLEIAQFAQTFETPEIYLFTCDTRKLITPRTQIKQILAILLQNAENPVSIEALETELWGCASVAKRNTLYSYICELRTILVACCDGANMIKAQKGAYILHFENIAGKIKSRR